MRNQHFPLQVLGDINIILINKILADHYDKTHGYNDKI